jgi:DUF4097 and DUF4098 domain-containing protein YvlB
MKKMFLTAAFIAANGMSAYCGSMKLVNEQVVGLEDVTAIEILYLAEDVTLLASNTSSLVIKEYMRKDKKDYYAEITKSGGKLTVKRGIPPLLPALLPFRASVEVYIPALSGKSLHISTTSAKVNADGEYACGQLSIKSLSGHVAVNVVAADTVSIQTTSGAITCKHVIGNADIRTSSGNILLNRTDGNLSVGATSGRIKVGQVAGSLSANSLSGDVRCDAVGESASVTTTSGHVQCEDVKGNASIRTLSGDICLGKAGGNASAGTTSGRIKVGQVAGSLAANSLSGDVRCDAAGGSIAITTTSGAIQAATAKNVERISLASTSGRINLEVPRSSSFSFSARTMSGKLSAPFSEKLTRPLSDEKLIQGVVGEAGSGGSIGIKTTSGAIKVGWIN